MSTQLIESRCRWCDGIRQSVAAAYGASGPTTALTRPGAFSSTPDRRRLADSESVVVTIRNQDSTTRGRLVQEGMKRPEGTHLLFRRALAAYASVSDLPAEQGVRLSGSRRVIDRAAVYKNRSYF